ncbi:hypothetical protein [Streptomyces sp. NPDC051452]|uniref:hypothetical protein n=1 Tax=Streptomyces sp. NPDC051452 TaxID=3365654 RepID=UPI00379E7BC0
MLDLVAALTASVEKAKATREETGPAEVHELPKPKKAIAKKQPAKKTAAKKTAGRRSRSA